MDHIEIELFGYTAVLNQTKTDQPWRIGSVMQLDLVSLSNPLEIEKYIAFLNAIRLKLIELNAQ